MIGNDAGGGLYQDWVSAFATPSGRLGAAAGSISSRKREGQRRVVRFQENVPLESAPVGEVEEEEMDVDVPPVNNTLVYSQLVDTKTTLVHF